jgi:hypothetical protein
MGTHARLSVMAVGIHQTPSVNVTQIVIIIVIILSEISGSHGGE